MIVMKRQNILGLN